MCFQDCENHYEKVEGRNVVIAGAVPRGRGQLFIERATQMERMTKE